MERITAMTTSQVKCFKTCRRRYQLEYVDMIKPIETPKALAIGSLYHEGIEMMLKGKPYDEVEIRLTEMQMWECENGQLDFDPINLFVALEMIRAWDQQSGWRNWQVDYIEKEFCVTTGYAKRLKGKIDMIVTRKEDGKRFLGEHKSTSMWGTDGTNYLNSLQLDEQATNYLYAYQRMLTDRTIDGGEVSGIFYDIIEKPTIKPYAATPVDKRKYTKDGKLYAGQHETDEAPEEYRKRVREWYESENRVHTAYVYRTPREIDAQVDDLNMTIRDVVSCEREENFYRNPDACKVLQCPYRAKCLENTADTDCLFVKKERKNEELA